MDLKKRKCYPYTYCNNYLVGIKFLLIISTMKFKQEHSIDQRKVTSYCSLLFFNIFTDISLNYSNLPNLNTNEIYLLKAESDRIRVKYPDRLPVIVEKSEKSKVQEIDKKKVYNINIVLKIQYNSIIIFSI